MIIETDDNFIYLFKQLIQKHVSPSIDLESNFDTKNNSAMDNGYWIFS